MNGIGEAGIARRPGHPAPLRVHRQRPHQHDLHPGPVQSRSRQRRTVPARLDLRLRQGDHPDPRRTAQGPVFLAPPNTSCPTWSPPCTTARSTSTWSATSTRSKARLRNTFEAAPDAPVTRSSSTCRAARRACSSTRPTSARAPTRPKPTSPAKTARSCELNAGAQGHGLQGQGRKGKAAKRTGPARR